MPNIEFSKSDFEISLREGECVKVRGITGSTEDVLNKDQGRYVCFRNGEIK